MAFDSVIPDGFPDLYTDQWRLELQQLQSRLAPFVDIVPMNGEGKRFQRLPKVNKRNITTRFGDTNPEDIDVEYRWLYVNFKDCAHRLDRREALQLGAVGSPHSEILKLQAAEAGRDMDETLVDDIIGTIQSGKTGSGSITLPSAQTIAVDYVDSGATANSGLTFAKLLEVATRFGVSQVFGQDAEMRSQAAIAISPRQLKNLLLEEKLTSADYGLRRLMSGEVVAAFGLAIKVVDPNILPYNSGTDVRTCVAWARNSVKFGVAENPTAFVDELPEKRHDIQLRTEWGWGATRLDDEGVISVLCDESP